MVTATLGQRKVAHNSPPGELTNMVLPIGHIDIKCLFTNSADMKACEAPESNKNVAGCELTGNVPTITSGAPSVVSAPI